MEFGVHERTVPRNERGRGHACFRSFGLRRRRFGHRAFALRSDADSDADSNADTHSDSDANSDADEFYRELHAFHAFWERELPVPMTVETPAGWTQDFVRHAFALEAITRTGRALGPGPLCQDGRHAQRVADLSIYIRQSHAERDLAELGRLAGQQAMRVP